MVSKYADESWYPDKQYTPEIENYLRSIEKIYKIQLGNGNWEHIILTPHQREFHSEDIVVSKEKAPYDWVIKSRNTSFTVNSSIRLLQGNYYYRDEIVPLSRINETKVKELIAEIQKIIKNMTPLQMRFCKQCKKLVTKETCCGRKDFTIDYFPFNKELVEYSALAIRFPDRGVVFQGYPALSKEAAEVIRGVRTTRGLIDESNYFRFFKEIYVAMRDSSRGSVIGSGNEEQHHQLTIGSTLKGYTQYYFYLEKIRKLLKKGDINKTRVLEWQVFNPEEFLGEISKEQFFELKTIVPWHTNNVLWNKYVEDEQSFLEEYMCVVSDSDISLYPSKKVLDVSTAEQWTFEDLKNYAAVNGGVFYGGVDPKGEGGHHWALTVFEELNGLMVQRVLEIITGDINLEDKTVEIDNLLQSVPFSKFRVDANGLGYQLGQSLLKKHPNVVEVIRGNVTVKSYVGGVQTRVPINEFLHTNLLTMINKDFLSLIHNELQLLHFSGWNRKYKAEEGDEIGHCDSVVAIGLACLPEHWKSGLVGYEPLIINNETELLRRYDEDSELDVKGLIESFQGSGFRERMKFYGKK